LKTEHERREKGIMLDDKMWHQIVSTAEDLGITS
jgi:LDH2 family malate/lactate/ureidoglycolate dehydrogenase